MDDSGAKASAKSADVAVQSGCRGANVVSQRCSAERDDEIDTEPNLRFVLI